MSIHTIISQQQINELLQSYSIGHCVNFSGIAAGITNSNYCIETNQNKFVLTLFEELTTHQLPFFVELMLFLADNNIPCPKPVADHNNKYIQIIDEKPAILVDFLPGVTPLNPTLAQCHAIGTYLATMHLATQRFPEKQQNLRGEKWHKITAEKVMPHLSNEDKRVLEYEIDYQQQQEYTQLPSGIIHADLFPDNTLFLNDKLTGMIDFYYACHGYYLWDLAVTVNSWCVDGKTLFDQAKTDALFAAYQQQRPLSQQEHNHWPAMRRSAALRFWLSRLFDYYYPSQGENVHIKDPNAIRNQLVGLQNDYS